ncbi:MAG: M36 family metallopeptidase [Gemmataceae bacterium]|nr:M36 family metallopeptidase [Gemmataceae bacterium]
MRARRDRTRATPLSVTRLEDRTVPRGGPSTDLVALPPQYYLAGPNSGFLSGPQAGDYQALAAQALLSHAATLGLSAADVADPITTDAYRDDGGTGAGHVYFVQKYNGLPVLSAKVGVHLTAAGEVITVNGGFVPGLAATAAGTPAAPTVTWTEAVAAAATYFGLTATAPPKVASSTGGLERAAVVDAPGVSYTPIPVSLTYTTTANGVRPAWRMYLDQSRGSDPHYYDAAVDAMTGQVVYNVDWVDRKAAYRVQAYPDGSPNNGPRQLLVNPADPGPSPFGWQDTNGVEGAEFTDTRGNNVYAQDDLDNNNAGGSRPAGGKGLFFDNPIDLTKEPETHIDGLVTNLFYSINVLHDVRAKYGFDEAGGNFQQKNYTGKGLGGDAVQADAMDGGGTDNANMLTLPDGMPGSRMQIYKTTVNINTGQPVIPNRGGELDNDTILHEFGHGVSNRLTGGPADASALRTVQSRGMGEGWSDYDFLVFTQLAGDGKNARRPFATYTNGETLAGNGIRQNPYSYDLKINPITFDSYNDNPNDIYNTGEAWTSSLWDMTWLLIDRYGFDPDLSTGYTAGKNPGLGAGGSGNKLALRLVTDAMKLQPANPSLIQARSALLSADVALTGGQNRRAIWAAFARRGLGSGAATSDSTSTQLTTAFDLPDAADNPGVVAQSPAGVTAATPGSLTLTFSEPMKADSFSLADDVVGFTGPAGQDLRGSITGFAWTSPTALRVDFTPPARAEGRYALTLGPNVLSADNATPLDQNFDAATGGTADGYTAYFGYDANPQTVTVAPVNATLESGQDSILVTFSEPVAAASLSPADLQLSAGKGPDQPTVAAVVPVSPTQARFDVTGLVPGPLYLSLKYGAGTDLSGFASKALNTTLTVVPAGPEIGETPLPVPLELIGPLGWQAYQGKANTWVGVAGDTDTFTFNLDGGSRLTAVVDQAPTLQAKVTLTGPLGTTVGTSTAAAPGGAAATAPVDAYVTGAYRLKVEGVGDTTGAYRVRLLFNAVNEAEGLGGAANDTRATAEGLDPALVPYGDGADGITAVGTVGGADPADSFSVPVAEGQTLSVGLDRLAGGATLQLLDKDGVSVGTTAQPDNFALGNTITAQAAGTYTVRVVGGPGLAADPYVLSIVRGGVIERESNGTPATGQTVPGTAVVRGGLVGGETDYYTVVLPAPANLTLATSTPAGGPGLFDNPLDPQVELYVLDPQGRPTLVTSVVDVGTGDGKNALLRGVGLPAGTYKVKVTGALGSAGEYLLRTTTGDPGPAGVRIGGPLTVAEGQPLTLAAAAVDPNGGALTYSWDLNGDGTFGDADLTGPTPAVDWDTLQGLGIDNGPGLLPYPVRFRVSDGTTTSTSTGVVLTVTNTPPSGTPTAGGSVGETEVLTVGFTDATDPSLADRTAGLRYSFDFDGDGKWDLGNGTYAGSKDVPQTTTVPPAFVADGPGAFTVRAVVIDQDGGTSPVALIPFTVTNAAPLAAFDDPGEFRENEDGRFLTVGGIVDSAADRKAGLRYSVDFDGDGKWEVGDGATYGGSEAVGDDNKIVVDRKYFPEGPAVLTVRAKVFDKDGASTEFVRDVTIANAAPTAALTTTGGTDEGGSAGVSLANAEDASAGDTAAGLRYSFDFDGDGKWDLGGGTFAGSDGVAASQAVPAELLADGTAAGLTVRARVLDRDGGFTDYAATIPVANVAPVARGGVAVAPAGGGPVTVGAPLTVTVAGVFDPSPVDTTAGFRYSYDLNNDGDFADAGEAADSPLAVYAIPGYQSPGPAVVRVRVADKDGGATLYTVPLTVANVAPTAAPAPAAPVLEGGAGTVRVAATHPSSVTTRAGFRYAFDFDGDGKFDLGTGASYKGGVASAEAAIPPALLTDGAGTVTVKVRVYELNGLFADVDVPVAVRNVGPTATLVPPAGRVEVRTPVTFTLAGATDPSPQDRAAGFTYSFDFNNDGDFADAGDVSGATAPAAVTQFGRTGPHTVRARVTDKDGGFTDYTATVTIGTLTKTWYAAGVGADNPPVARLYDGAGTVRFAGQVFQNAATGGVRVSVADVNADGTPDLVAASGPGLPAEVAVVDGKTQAVLFRTRPFGTFAGGAFVAAGDVDGDGRAEIVVTPDQGGGPRVVVYNGDGFRQAASFFGIQDPNFRGGARAALADVNGDGLSDLLVSAGFGGGPRVAGFDAQTLFTSRQKLFADFFAFDTALRNGVYLSGGDMDGDGQAEVVLGAGPGGGPQVIALDGLSLLEGRRVERANFFADDINNRGGVRVTVADVDDDGRADIVTGDATGPGLSVFRGSQTLASGRPVEEVEFFPFSALMNGVFVG